MATLAGRLAPQTGGKATSLRQSLPQLLQQDVIAQWRAEIELEAELPALRVLYRRTLAEIQGKFSRNEITLIATTFGTMRITEHLLARPEIIIDHFEDVPGLEDLQPKLQALTAAQSYYLLREVVLWSIQQEGVMAMADLYKTFKAQ